MRARRVERPLLDLELFRNRAFSAASIVTFCLGARAVRRDDPACRSTSRPCAAQDALDTGLLLIPQGVGGGLGMALSGRATERLGAGLTSLIGGLVLAAATLPFVLVTATTPFATDRRRDARARHRRRAGDHAGDDGRVLGARAASRSTTPARS